MTRLLGAVAALAIGASAAPALAFHSGGVGDCDGCHTMHNSLGDDAVTPATPQYTAPAYLLRGSDASSTCLVCHAGSDATPFEHHVMTYPVPSEGNPPTQLSPAGDFGWLLKEYAWDRDGSALRSKGERHGHSVIARDYTLEVDSTIATSPGGSYPSASLSCISCHDPHGRYRRLADGSIVTGAGEPTLPISGSGSYATSPEPITGIYAVGVYRLLGGIGYAPKSVGGTNAFQYQVFAAISPVDYNRSEDLTQTRVAYGRSVSLWCANCHEQMHTTFGTVVHPADQALGSDVTAHYNAYRKTGTLGGSAATSFLSLVPFQLDNTLNYLTLKNQAYSNRATAPGPISTDRVMCLSCHRAHASAWDSMMRWSLGHEFLTVGDAAGIPSYPDPATTPDVAQGRSRAEWQAASYGRPASVFAPFQRSLCNKCHIQD